MRFSLIEARDLRKRWDAADPKWGPQATVDDLAEKLELGRAKRPGGLRFQDFSIRDLFESLVPDGERVVRMMEGNRRGGRHHTPLIEATNAVDTSAFSAVVGQLAFSTMLEAYENPEYIWSQLVETRPTKYLWGEKIPGVANLGDVGLAIKEGDPYPLVGTSASYIETVKLEKSGFIVPVTREITIADNTGLVIDRCSKTANALTIKNEKAAVNLAIGATGYNNYKRNGTSTNTYLTSGAYVNSKTSNALYDWRNVEALDLFFAAMNDPDTGEPIIIGKDNRVLLVPNALRMTGMRVLSATEIEHVDNTASATTVRTKSANPLAGQSITLLSTPYLDRLGNSTDWFYGNPKKAFAKFTAWEIEQDQLGRDSHLGFNNDIIYQFKGSKMDAFQVTDPRYMVKSAA